MIGQIIAHYRIVAEIGRGGMGVVYQAEDTRLHCDRALKFLPATVTPDSPDHARLVNEARALATLEHPNICPVQEIGEHEGQTYIVMSYLEGRTLKDRLAEGPIPLEEALEISRQIAAGLAAAHAKGIVHRDVKPENVMLCEAKGETRGRPRVVLMDFGIAKKQDTTLATRTGTVMGTVAYMSPEQAQGEKVDAATDVWATGVILYEMLAGKRPFAGDHEPALLYAIVNTEPAALVGIDHEVPEAVERVIGQALTKDRKSRYTDGAALLTDLERASAGEAVKGRSLVKRRRGRLLTGVAGLFGLILVGLFVWPGILVPEDAISALAVMPLEDRSEGADQAFLSEGIADELATGLNKIEALSIVSRNSASRARELYPSNREIGEQLGVDALIEGSIQRDGDRIRVSVQLVATEDDQLLWSESYTRDMTDILNLQSEIALAISSALETELTPQEQESLARDRQIDPEAYNEYLLGRHYQALTTAESCAKAIEHYEKALVIEPDYAMAHIALAYAHLLYQQMAGLPVSAAAELARGHARRAMKIAPELAASHAAMAGAVLFFDWDLSAAGADYARARELDPNLSMMVYAQYLNVVGRHQDALREARIAARQEPLNPFIQANLAARYMLAGHLEEALDVLDRLEEWEPGFWIGLWARGQILILQGKPVEAVAVLQQSVSNSDDAISPMMHLAGALVLAGRRDETLAILADLEAQAEEAYVPPFYLGVVHAALGNADEAFAAFEAAFAERDWFLLFLEADISPSLRALETDPRWDDLIRRIGIPRL